MSESKERACGSVQCETLGDTCVEGARAHDYMSYILKMHELTGS